jgi:hypothetical protein
MSANTLPRPARFVRFLERWLDRWLAGVPGREQHDAWAAEAMRLGL